MRVFGKRPLLLVLAVLILLDLLAVQTVLSRDDNDATTPRAASTSRTPPGVSPVTVSPPSVVPGDAASPRATSGPVPTDTPTTGPDSTPTPEALPTPEDDDPPGRTGSEPQIRIDGPSFAGRAFETVRMNGTYAGTGARTILRVQQRKGGTWVDFPLPTTTDEAGSFTARVEFGSTGEHEIRVVDPLTDTVSQTLVVVIR